MHSVLSFKGVQLRHLSILDSSRIRKRLGKVRSLGTLTSLLLLSYATPSPWMVRHGLLKLDQRTRALN